MSTGTSSSGHSPSTTCSRVTPARSHSVNASSFAAAAAPDPRTRCRHVTWTIRTDVSGSGSSLQSGRTSRSRPGSTAKRRRWPSAGLAHQKRGEWRPSASGSWTRWKRRPQQGRRLVSLRRWAGATRLRHHAAGRGSAGRTRAHPRGATVTKLQGEDGKVALCGVLMLSPARGASSFRGLGRPPRSSCRFAAQYLVLEP
jgi:hypothetical protein